MQQEILDTYLSFFPEERENLRLLLEQIAANEPLNTRKNFRGHITGAGIVLSPDRTNILIVKHKASGKWLHPGGHWDEDDPDPLEAAKREVREETQVPLREYLPINTAYPLVPLSITTHFIPARTEKSEPDHYHHDFRYVFIAENESIMVDDEGVAGAEWMSLNDSRINGLLKIISSKLSRFGFIR